MLINVAGFVFAVGLTAFVFSYFYRRLGNWGVGLFTANSGQNWTLRLLGVALMFGSGALWSYSLSTPPMQVKEPVEEWLSLMDDANYEVAWDQGTEALQQSVSAAQFTKLAEVRRKPLGHVVGRVQTAAVDLSALPDGREGAFKLYVYRTKFASGAEIEETVVVEADSDEWGILNYNLDRITK